ncbi:MULTISPECIES: phenylacetaldoxime dehydratase family protein [Streptosporangium]|uniref:Aldoxime dehydratase n=1 Tax=Streptosporangium brasiliense TaxID=47480 RepID=A0ABT9RFA8_9ACTN|nr:phenylacetaldoxime dehydratase family protein [Streptosporangium brasiliense]MDP9867945.1 aldoxime dehydratase [Streptosporangium brasiliense]
MAKIRPAGFENPYPAYSLRLPEQAAGVTLRQLAVQHRGSAEARRVLARMLDGFGGAHAPVTYEHATHVDRRGYTNDVLLAYWLDAGAEKAWSAAHPLGSWADPGLTAAGGPIGLWTEVLWAPPDHFETSYSYDSPSWGLASQFPAALNVCHSYPGSMRDRIAAAEDGGLAGEVASVQAGPVDSAGRHLVVATPRNLCFIRSPQGWRHCPDDERAWFEERVLPVYREGVGYLTEHPDETGCLSACLAELPVSNDERVQTTTLAWFLSLSHLEQWAHSHPTHLAIYKSAGELIARFAPEINVTLGHEVYVPPEGGLMEYLNCHDQTGLLPYFGPPGV